MIIIPVINKFRQDCKDPLFRTFLSNTHAAAAIVSKQLLIALLFAIILILLIILLDNRIKKIAEKYDIYNYNEINNAKYNVGKIKNVTDRAQYYQLNKLRDALILCTPFLIFGLLVYMALK